MFAWCCSLLCLQLVFVKYFEVYDPTMRLSIMIVVTFLRIGWIGILLLDVPLLFYRTYLTKYPDDYGYVANVAKKG